MIKVDTKICSKCKLSKPINCFYEDKRASDERCSWCSSCMNKTTRKWQKRNPVKAKAAVNKYRGTHKGREAKKRNAVTYRNTLKGYLQEVYNHIRQRCTNPSCHNYYAYGGRGIRNKFESFDEFVNHIMNKLNIKTLEQVKGLQIDRIDNDGHYEFGNIRFITPKENCNNRRKVCI